MRGIKNNNYFLIYILLLLFVESSLTIFKIVVAEKEDCTDLARDEETLLVFSTLGGGLTAIDPLSSEIRWTIADEPAVKSIHKDDFTLPQYLPDPRDGSLYQLGNMGDLKKLPYTIPELVANAPCRSSDGILYSGKKSDTWFLIDPKTGRRKKLMGFGGGSGSSGGTSNGFNNNNNNNQNQNQKNGKYDDETIGWATSRSIYLGRTQYTVLMYDSLSKEKSTKPWNITFYDYASHSMAPEVTKEYEYLHLAGSSSGLIVTLDRQQGKLIWQKDLSSPVIAVFLLSSEGLLSVPFTTVSDEALHSIIDDAKTGGINEVKLFQSLYVGEHLHGLYAIPSLVDKDTPTMSSTPSAKLIEGDGPINDSNDQINVNEKQNEEQKKNSNRKLVYIDKLLEKQNNVIVLGHYGVPKVTDEIELKISATNRKFIDNKQLSTISNLDLIQGNKDFILIDGIRTNTVGIQTDSENIVNDNDNDDDDNNSVDNNDRKNLNKSRKNRISTTNSSTSTTSKLQTSDTGKKVIIKIFDDSKAWLTDQQSGRTHQILIVLILSVIGMFWYTCSTVRELRQNSQNGSNSTNRNSNNSGSNMNCQELIDLGNGEIKVGKITFNCNEVLGKGCEGTFVFRGSFEKRNVAVKRLLPECFSFADREVTLLRESDAHENVVRYFCTEQDRQFRYIAVELCAATLQDYTVGGDISKELREKIDVWNVLRQATNGLAHLHSLNIVHRDIKPQNVLLSLPDINNRVRVMISDFGLCKKLNHGKTSFSRRSGITGTEGWIAPEMIKGQRTTTSVDIFSLGCVYYYVLSEGDHAFGDNLKRQANILSNEFDLKKLTSGDEMHSQLILAEQLIADMIHYDAQKRPTARAICNHPMFWNEEKILSFLQDVSDRVEKLMYTIEPLRTLEKNCKFIVRDDWNLHLETAITDDLRKYRGYTGISVRDLLRAIRNKRHHYHELSIKAQTTLGNIPQEFTNYWIKKFPYLLSHTYHALRICSNENPFKSYYDNNYNFSLPKYFYDDNCESPLVLENCLKLNNNNNYKNNNSGNNSNNNNNNNNNNSISHHNHYHHGGGSPRKYLLEKIQKSHKGSYNFHRNQNQNQQQNYGGSGINNADNLQKISEEITRGDGSEAGEGGGGGGEKYEGDGGDGDGVGANNFEKRNNFTNFRFRNKSRAGGQKQIHKNVTWIMND